MMEKEDLYDIFCLFEKSLKIPCGPVVRIQHFLCRGLGSIPGTELRSHKPCGAAKERKHSKNLRYF